MIRMIMNMRMMMMTTISALFAAARRVMPPSSFFERASCTLAPASLPRCSRADLRRHAAGEWHAANVSCARACHVRPGWSTSACRDPSECPHQYVPSPLRAEQTRTSRRQREIPTRTEGATRPGPAIWHAAFSLSVPRCNRSVDASNRACCVSASPRCA